ncbi:MAG TPA: hypothetical protein PLB10_17935 [Thiolinea sp.]|nr:hypothetical protein [Thiolinea sp.]
MKILPAILLFFLSFNAWAIVPPERPTPVLQLSITQQSALRTLLNLIPSSPFTVSVLDQDRNRRLSSGDIAVVRGGMANAEVRRRVLDADDIAALSPGRSPARHPDRSAPRGGDPGNRTR